MREGKSRADLRGELAPNNRSSPSSQIGGSGTSVGIAATFENGWFGRKALALEQHHLLEAVEEIVLLARRCPGGGAAPAT